MAAPQKSEFGNSLDLVDIQEIRGNVVIVKDGSLKQIVMVGGVNFSLKSETEQNIITQGYQTFLNSIDFPLQIVIHSRKVNIDKYIERLAHAKGGRRIADPSKPDRRIRRIYPGLRAKECDHGKNISGGCLVLSDIGMLPSKKVVSSCLPFFGEEKCRRRVRRQRPEDARRKPNKHFGENLAQLDQRTGQVMSGLLNIGLEATVLENDALIELFYNFYNPQTIEREKITVPKDDNMNPHQIKPDDKQKFEDVKTDHRSGGSAGLSELFKDRRQARKDILCFFLSALSFDRLVRAAHQSAESF